MVTATVTTSRAPTAPTLPDTRLLLVLKAQVPPQYQCVSEARHLGTHARSSQSTSVPYTKVSQKKKMNAKA